MPPLRVLVVAAPLRIIGGQEVQAAELVAHLPEDGTVRTSFLSNAPLLPGPLAPLQRVRYLRTALQSLAYGWLLLARVRRHDVVHVLSAASTSFAISAAPAILAARLLGRKAVLNYHSGAVEEHLRDWPRSAPALMRGAAAVVVPSARSERIMRGHGVPARTLPNAIELDRFPFRRRDPPRPVFLVNRALKPTYNVACVLRAFALVQAGVPDARLIVVGDGPQRRSLERLAAELGLRGTAFRGWVAPGEMDRVYDEADILLNGSDVDAAPLTILEAWAAGLPVVTTDAGGIPDMVRDGENGILVPRGDHAALAAAARRVLSDAGLARALVANGRRAVLEHDWDVVRPLWVELYRELVAA
jgi:glycosyltransferase involved in cell wall biosynthesis